MALKGVSLFGCLARSAVIPIVTTAVTNVPNNNSAQTELSSISETVLQLNRFEMSRRHRHVVSALAFIWKTEMKCGLQLL